MSLLIQSVALILLLHTANAIVYNVKPDDDDDDDDKSVNSGESESAEYLEYYMLNSSKYFSSYSTLNFKMGKYYLNTDLVIQNITNVTMIGEGEQFCVIRCASSVSIIIFNVTNFSLKNITFVNCNANYSHHFHTKFAYDSTFISSLRSNASIFIQHCKQVEISKTAIKVTQGSTGLALVDVRHFLKITNVSIIVQPNRLAVNNTSLQTTGILLYYDNWKNPCNISKIQLDNFHFTINGSYPHPIYHAITSLLIHDNTNVSIVIQNTTFDNLINVTALYYYGETCGISVSNNLEITNCNIFNNTGNFNLKTFHITLDNRQCITLTKPSQLYYLQQHTRVNFTNCRFENNHNMKSMIYVSPASSRATTGYFYLDNNTFDSNSNTHFFIMESITENIWQASNYVEVNNTNATSNVHAEGQHLMSFTNSIVKFNGPILCVHNHYYTSLAKFHLSVCTFQYNISICNNTARQLMSTTFIILEENTTVNISQNTVYLLFNRDLAYSMNSEVICSLQFYSGLESYNVSHFSVHAIMSNNIHTSKYLPNYDYNCRWLASNVFQINGLLSTSIFEQLLQIENNTEISYQEEKRPIPLSICKCESPKNGTDRDHGSYCYTPHLGTIFPGQTLKVKLIIQKQWLYHNRSIPIVAENTKTDDCSILDVSQLSQTHLNNTCNSYSYTLWPINETAKVCKLFIGLLNMPETFYVEFKHCPLGFTLQQSRKSCYCDPVLTDNDVVHIESCSLSDETILRPAHSWISANNYNAYNTTYVVSSYCPFYHCLPHQSSLNLSNPDSQCQFQRTGLLCGKCQQGLSTVFGSKECKKCSNIYLLLIIPIALAGIGFVTLLYVFNLTVRNGTVNTCIFYVNIININVYTYFPSCQSFTCAVLSYMNFDFRTNTCFYNGMDDYAKEWLHLILPFYLISIATIFIILSRYYATVQRLTARKALPVLSTLFLFSFTKISITVCNALFRYSQIIHLPSNKTELVWSISTTTPLFGLKFMVLFIVCILLFLILLPFNFILLFTRTLSCLRFVTTLKPILDTYFAPYRDSAYFWTGLLLLIRMLVYVLSASDEDVSLVAIPALLGGLLCLHAAVQPFKSKFHNIQECITILNLLVITSALSYAKHLVGLKLAKVLILMGVVYFMLAIAYNCIMYRWNEIIYKGIKFMHCKFHEVKGIKLLFHNIHNVKSSQEECSDHRSFRMEGLNKIKDDYDNYNEFQDPLLALET